MAGCESVRASHAAPFCARPLWQRAVVGPVEKFGMTYKEGKEECLS